MSYDTSRDTITVAGVTYDVERSDRGGATVLTIEREGEPVFEGIEGKVGYDEFQESSNPRDWSNVSTMLVNYRGYTLGDGENEDEDGAFYIERDDESVLVDPATYYRTVRGARVVMPLFVYEHSGITIRVGAPIRDAATRDDVRSTGRFVGDDAGWDTSFVGFVFDTPERVNECIGEDATNEQIEAALRSEVEVYASYLEGDVTYFSVEDDETGFYEACGGYVGDTDHCEAECFAALESAIERRLAEIAERAHWAARDLVTV
jgi:hypothetical protein